MLGFYIYQLLREYRHLKIQRFPGRPELFWSAFGRVPAIFRIMPQTISASYCCFRMVCKPEPEVAAPRNLKMGHKILGMHGNFG